MTTKRKYEGIFFWKLLACEKLLKIRISDTDGDYMNMIKNQDFQIILPMVTLKQDRPCEKRNARALDPARIEYYF